MSRCGPLDIWKQMCQQRSASQTCNDRLMHSSPAEGSQPILGSARIASPALDFSTERLRTLSSVSALANNSGPRPAAKLPSAAVQERTVPSGGFNLYSMEMFEDPGDLSDTNAMVAGASAGVMEHLCMFPVDTAKTRMQEAPGPNITKYNNVVSALSHISRVEGPMRLYRGLGAVLTGAVPSHALSFAVLERFKELTGGNEPGHHVISNAFCGAMATMAHDAVITPLDVVKQRMQVTASPYGSVLQCTREIFKQEGFRAFYASYPVTVVMNIPFMAVSFATFEALKLTFSGGADSSMPQQLAAGGLAGAAAGFVSTPLDVIKTRIQTDHISPGQSRPSARSVARHILETEGRIGFMRGATARVLYFIPSAAICWTTYETVKKFLLPAP